MIETMKLSVNMIITKLVVFQSLSFSEAALDGDDSSALGIATMSPFSPASGTFLSSSSQQIVTGVAAECTCRHACMVRSTCQAAAYSEQSRECRLSRHHMSPNNTEQAEQQDWLESHKSGSSPLTRFSEPAASEVAASKVAASEVAASEVAASEVAPQPCRSVADCQRLVGPSRCLLSHCACLEGFLLSDSSCLLDPDGGAFAEGFSGGPAKLRAFTNITESACQTSCQSQTPHCVGFRFDGATCSLHAADSLSPSPHPVAVRESGTQQDTDSVHMAAKATDKVFGFHRPAGNPQQQWPEQLWTETPDGRRVTLLSDSLRNTSGIMERCRQLDSVLFAPRSLHDLLEVMDALGAPDAALPHAEIFTPRLGFVDEGWAAVQLGITKVDPLEPEFTATTDEEFEYNITDWDPLATNPGRRAYVTVDGNPKLGLTRKASLTSAICQYLGRDVSRLRAWNSTLGGEQVLSVDLGAIFQVQAVRFTSLSRLPGTVTVEVWVQTPAGGEAHCGTRTVFGDLAGTLDSALACAPAVYGRAVRMVAFRDNLDDLQEEAIGSWPAVYGNQLTQEDVPGN